ncbi:hypothetical protein [Sphaerochaeta sp.]|jgi:hypothetical protein|uniref:hypothetical protein n=1 Tax=Sphaerochaeta sp. TaxID=1972642 RepID=UPI002FC72791
MLNYDLRVKLEVPFDYYRIYQFPKDAEYFSFTRLLWYGYDEQGPAIYRQDPKTGQVVRVDFLPQ